MNKAIRILKGLEELEGLKILEKAYKCYNNRKKGHKSKGKYLFHRRMYCYRCMAKMLSVMFDVKYKYPKPKKRRRK